MKPKSRLVLGPKDERKARSRSVSTTNRIFIPSYLDSADKLCLLHHDILVEMLRSGEEHQIFHQRFAFRDDADQKAFEQATDIFVWLEKTRQPKEWAIFIRRSVFPALLSDFLHFIYEALSASRKAKLAVAYALLRKPLQDTLGILEGIAIDPSEFVATFRTDPSRLRPMKAGGITAHQVRIAKVLETLGESDRFDAAYLAGLRYGKETEDGFDGICNQALHLITDHPAIRTERLNFNLVFSGDDARQTQWYYLYSRLPYVLHYARLLLEHLVGKFSATKPAYLEGIERRVGAATLLWWPALESNYRSAELEKYVGATALRIVQSCHAAGAPAPTVKSLRKMRDTGALPTKAKRSRK